MRRSDVNRKLRKLLGEMKPHLSGAGVDNPEAFLDGLDARPDDEAVAYLGWLESFKVGDAYRAFMRVWGERPPEWWANMSELFGENDLREHRELRPLAKAVRAAWRKKHPKRRPAA